VIEAEHSNQRHAASHITATLGEMFAWLDQLAEQLQGLHARARAAGGHLYAADLAALRDPIFIELSSQPQLIAGTGVVLASDALGDRTHWLEWWQKAPHAAPAFLEVEHDPNSAGFYDYASTSWFDRPRRTGQRIALGPYVDYAGTDEYIVTLAEPAVSEDRFLGIAGVDIRASAIEALLLGSIRPSETPTALISSSGRVIASNTTTRTTGSLLPSESVVTTWPVEAPQPGTTPTACVGLPWSLAILSGSVP
jgi:hypothetical protein